MRWMLPERVKCLARRYIEKRGYVRGPLAADIHAAMSRRSDVTVQTVIDVGASDGRWSAAVMQYFPLATYLLIEAQKQVHGPGLEKFKASHANIAYELCAAGDHDGEIHFDASEPFGGVASPVAFKNGDITVPMRRIDSLVSSRGLRGPFMIKLDTHGFEVPILNGAVETLSRATMLVIEAYNFTLCQGCLRFYELRAFLEERGFGAWISSTCRCGPATRRFGRWI